MAELTKTHMGSGSGSVPVPDPTVLTTAQLTTAILGLREILEAKLNGTDKVIEQLKDAIDQVTTAVDDKMHHLQQLTEERFKSVQKQFDERDARTTDVEANNKTAIDAALTAAKEVRTAITEKTEHLQELHDEKFRSIQVQFVERDVRTDQTSRDAKKAVEDALTAAKEAVAEQNRSSALSIAKSEASTIKSIDQQGLLIATSTKALDDKIIDVKDRITRLEGQGVGKSEETTTRNVAATHSQINNGQIIAMVIAGSSIIGLIILIAEKLIK